MFKSGFSSQSEGMELWDVEELAGLEDVVEPVDEFEEPGDDGPPPLDPSSFFRSLPGLPEERERWLRGCAEESLYCQPTLASRRLRLRCGKTKPPMYCRQRISYRPMRATRVKVMNVEDLTGQPMVCISRRIEGSLLLAPPIEGIRFFYLDR